MKWVQLCGSVNILWHCPSLGLEWNPKDLFHSSVHSWVFQISWHIECSTLTASSFRIWNSLAGIPSLILALFVVMLPKAHLTSHSQMSGSRWVKHLTMCQTWCKVLWMFYLIQFPHEFHKMGIISIDFLQMREVKYRDVKSPKETQLIST